MHNTARPWGLGGSVAWAIALCHLRVIIRGHLLKEMEGRVICQPQISCCQPTRNTSYHLCIRGLSLYIPGPSPKLEGVEIGQSVQFNLLSFTRSHLPLPGIGPIMVA
ncbi:hypothetical protein B0T25DRAFT_544350 [Lasiosphaeria hispida]|uniref:Uncharacterized protein n=1 Tax=Lasiosphaeria hispida TaxID=260671 RepID=A0AAJ0MED2_9PEZI|nr:hypothetical protein B0T25DRAFT_544350 [Lasiosphaeria hispida]